MLYEGISLLPTTEELDKKSEAATPPKITISVSNNNPLASPQRRRNRVNHKGNPSKKDINVHWYGI